MMNSKAFFVGVGLIKIKNDLKRNTFKKMNANKITFILLIISKIFTGQNLIPNGDFEQYYHCPNGIGQIDSSISWFHPTVGKPSYYNQCSASNVNVPNATAGYQNAHSGAGFAGITCFYQLQWNYREYLEIQLDSTLINNVCYNFKMFINLPNNNRYANHTIGVYFSDTIINEVNYGTNLPLNPQLIYTIMNPPDTLNWTQVGGTYTAHGGEKFLIIGNFKDDLNTDTTLINTSAYYEIVSYYIDDVTLTSCTIGIDEMDEKLIAIYPNPTIDKLILKMNNDVSSEITIYDINSKNVLHQEFTNELLINTKSFNNGIYFYVIKNKKGIVKKGKILKN